MNSDPILTADGAFLAPPQSSHDERAAGPWRTNADNPLAARRGRDVRQALAGELPRAAREASTIERMNAAHPGASWHFVTHPTVGRILVSVPGDDDVAPAPPSPEVLAELANGRRA